MVLALELALSTVLIDERNGRAVARHLNLAPKGVLGILLRAKGMGSLTSVRDAMAALEESHFRIHPRLFQQVIEQAGEE